jgi:hypothetical protein
MIVGATNSRGDLANAFRFPSKPTVRRTHHLRTASKHCSGESLVVGMCQRSEVRGAEHAWQGVRRRAGRADDGDRRHGQERYSTQCEVRGAGDCHRRRRAGGGSPAEAFRNAAGRDVAGKEAESERNTGRPSRSLQDRPRVQAASTETPAAQLNKREIARGVPRGTRPTGEGRATAGRAQGPRKAFLGPAQSVPGHGDAGMAIGVGRNHHPVTRRSIFCRFFKSERGCASGG